MNNTKTLRPFGWRDKLGYAMGDMGCGFTFQLVTAFMQLFYLQYIGISPADYAVIILISKAFDAVNDIVIGNLVDTKKIGKKSKYMPWILLGSVTLIIFNVMIFAPVKNFPYWGKYVWCLVSYCLWSVSYTMVNVPYGSLHSAITDKPNERTALSTFRSIGAALPAIIIMVVLPGIVYNTTTDASGVEVQTLKGATLLPVAAIMSVVALVILWGTTRLVTERVQREETGENVTGMMAMMSSVKAFFTNRAMVGATLATIASVALFNSTMSLNNMVFQYFFKDASKIGMAMIGSYAPMAIVIVFVGKLTAKFGKKKLIAFATLISSIGGLALMLMPMSADSNGMILYICTLMLLNTGNCIFQVTVWAIVADCIEVSYRKTGKAEEGSLYALYSFFRKLSQGIGQAVVSVGLGAIGFIEGENAIQPESFGTDVKNLYILVLVIGSFLTFASMQFIYNISKKDEEEFATAAMATVEKSIGKGLDD